MQIYVKIFTICHHAPIKIAYMAFRKKMTSSDKSFVLHFGGTDYLWLARMLPPQAERAGSLWVTHRITYGLSRILKNNLNEWSVVFSPF